MLLNFVSFEIKYRLRLISTYLYFAIFFVLGLLCVATADFGPVPAGKVFLNGPYALALYQVFFSIFGLFIISAMFGTSILRDFQRDTYALFFTRPIRKLDYLGGRWAGSLIITLLIMSGSTFGALLGSVVPWAEKDRIAPIHLEWFLQPFVLITVLQVFALGSIFFFIAAMSRRVVVVYMQGAILFGLYIIITSITQQNRALDTFWPSVLDPLGLAMFANVTRYLTVVERNTNLLQLTGPLLYNRLLWLGLGCVAVVLTGVMFPMSAEALTAGKLLRRKKQAAEEEDEARPTVRRAMVLPAVQLHFGAAALWSQFVSSARMRFLSIVRDVPFLAIAAVMMALVVVNSYFVGRFRDTAIWPVTYLVASIGSGVSGLFLIIVATLYGGELVWRDRELRVDQIRDAMPVPSWVEWLSRFVALCAIEFTLLTVVMVGGIAAQAANGYFKFELPVYFQELYLIAFPTMVFMCLYALMVHTLLPNKFFGHAIVVGSILLVPFLERYGFEERIFLIGELPSYTYSDMNGLGHFVLPVLWMIVYWLAIGGLCAVVSLALFRRGTDTDWSSRWRAAGVALPGLVPLLAFSALVAVGAGGWIYYNAHVLNEFRTEKISRHLQAAYEKAYKKYEHLPQPKVTAVDCNVDILPQQRSMRVHGSYLLVNQGGAAIQEVHVASIRESVDGVRFDRGSQLVSGGARKAYSIYKLDKPLAPGESMKMDFDASWTSHGFREIGERPEFAYNGTFFDRDYLPTIGYNRELELDNPVRRKEEGLPALEELPPRGDPEGARTDLFTADSTWIRYHTVVSTSPDQTAIAPGYLKREWTANGRHYFEYDMGPAEIHNFFSYLSGRYKVVNDRYNDIKLQIFYHPGHEYNLSRMMDASKKGLAYFEKSFGPYQYQQFRVIEYPRYRTFAQSFPNTVPFSEGLGFIQRVQKKTDLDEIFYVTAHELAHQWWGHQIVGGFEQGSNMMSESLAQYSALMLMEKEYGPASVRKFLKHELDGYLSGRGGETRKEPPLALVQNEPYVWYNKGSLVMYAMRDYIGEEKLNGALAKFVKEHGMARDVYPNTLMFVQAIRDASPPEYQNLITDMFERITLYDNRAVAATWVPSAGGKYQVDVDVEARKSYADGQGKETEAPLSEWIDVGVFRGTKQDLEPLLLAKQHITAKKGHYTFTVDKEPAFAGIDPYNKLIDRKPDDNLIAVSKK